jgi:hypothetical protein
LRLISGGLIFAGAFQIITAFAVGHRVSRYLIEKETAQEEPAYTEQEYAYTPQDNVYTTEEPVYTGETAYEESAGQMTEERPVEMEIPSETDLPSGEKTKGFGGLFKRKKS